MGRTWNIAVAIFGKSNLPYLAFILILRSGLNISCHIFGAHVPGTLYSLNLILMSTLQTRSCYPFYKLGNWDPEKLTNLPKDMELANDKVKLQDQAWPTPHLILSPTVPIWFPMGMTHSLNERKVWQRKMEWWRWGKGKFRHFELMVISMKVLVLIISTFPSPHVLRAHRVKLM